MLHFKMRPAQFRAHHIGCVLSGYRVPAAMLAASFCVKALLAEEECPRPFGASTLRSAVNPSHQAMIQ